MVEPCCHWTNTPAPGERNPLAPVGVVFAAVSACWVLLSEADSTDNLTEPLANYTRENQPGAPQKCDKWCECLEEKPPARIAISKSTGRHTEHQQDENDDK